MNQHIKAAVIRLAVDSEMELPSLRTVAKYAGTTERQAFDVLRDYVYDLRAASIRPGSGGLGGVRSAV